MDDLDFIKEFSKISISDICKKKNVDRTNVITGRASAEKTKKVRKGIESEIGKLFIEPEELKETKKDE